MAMDLYTSLGAITVGIAASMPMVIPWLQRRGVVRTGNKAEESALTTLKQALDTQKALTEEQRQIAEAWRAQSETHRASRIDMERKLDEAYQQQRVEREATYTAFMKDKVADRQQIETLSRNVHELTMKVTALTLDNEQLRKDVHDLSTMIGDGYATKTPT